MYCHLEFVLPLTRVTVLLTNRVTVQNCKSGSISGTHQARRDSNTL